METAAPGRHGSCSAQAVGAPPFAKRFIARGGVSFRVQKAQRVICAAVCDA